MHSDAIYAGPECSQQLICLRLVMHLRAVVKVKIIEFFVRYFCRFHSIDPVQHCLFRLLWREVAHAGDASADASHMHS